MVLDTIDTIHAEQPNVATKHYEEDPLSPISAVTESSPNDSKGNTDPESRDAGVAPCDSIRSYAKELTGSLSNSGELKAPLAILVPAIPTAAVEEEEQRDEPEEPVAKEKPDATPIVEEVVTTLQESTASETKAVDEESSQPAVETPAAESEAKAVVASKSEESQDKSSSSSIEAGSNDTGKKKKFGLKLSKTQKVVRSTSGGLTQKVVRSTSGGLTKGMSKMFTKPSLGKRSKKSGSPVPLEEAAILPDQPAKQESSENEESSTKQEKTSAKQEEAVPVQEEAPKEEETKTIDPNADTDEPLVELVEPVEPVEPAEPVLSEKSPSAPAVKESTSTEAQEAETKENQEEKEPEEQKDEEVGEVHVAPEVTEIVAALAEEVPADIASVPDLESSPSLLDLIQGKADSWLDVVTDLCGPTPKTEPGLYDTSEEADKVADAQNISAEVSSAYPGELVVGAESKEADTEEANNLAPKEADIGKTKSDSTDASANVAALKEVDIAKAQSDNEDATSDAAAAIGDTTQEGNEPAYTPPVLIASGAQAAPTVLEAALLSPHPIATEAAPTLMDTIKANDSFKSIVENFSNGLDSVSKATEALLFPVQAEGEKAKVDEGSKAKDAEQKSEQEKLDKAARMAKQALDKDTQEEEQQQEKVAAEKTQPNKIFGFRRMKDKKKTKQSKKTSKPTTSSKQSKSQMSLFKRGLNLFKKPMNVGNKENAKGASDPSSSKAKIVSEEAMAIGSQDVQDDMGSPSLNSQSLNEPQPSAEEKAPVPTTLTEGPKPASQENVLQEDASSPAPANEPKQEAENAESVEAKPVDATPDAPTTQAPEKPAPTDSTPTATTPDNTSTAPEEPKEEATPLAETSKDTPTEKDQKTEDSSS